MKHIDQRLRDATPHDPDGRTVIIRNPQSKLNGLTGTLQYVSQDNTWLAVKMHDDNRVVSANFDEVEEVTGH